MYATLLKQTKKKLLCVRSKKAFSNRVQNMEKMPQPWPLESYTTDEGFQMMCIGNMKS